MKNNSFVRYYAISGRNGVAVMDSMAGVEQLTKYIKDATICDFSQFESAEFWALADFRNKSPYGARLTYLQLNRAIFNSTIAAGKTSRRKKS